MKKGVKVRSIPTLVRLGLFELKETGDAVIEKQTIQAGTKKETTTTELKKEGLGQPISRKQNPNDGTWWNYTEEGGWKAE